MTRAPRPTTPRGLRAPLFALILSLGCHGGLGCHWGEIVPLPRGATVPVESLRSHATNLNALVTERLAANEAEAAFFVLDVEKSRALASLLAKRRGASTVAASPDLTSLVRVRPSGGADDPNDPASGDESRGLVVEAAGVLPALDTRRAADEALFWDELLAVERRHAALENELFSYELLFRGRFMVATVSETQHAQAPDQALISYFVGADAVWAFVARRDQFRARELPIAPAALRQLVSTAVDGLAHPGRGDWRASARKLHDVLVTPLEEALQGARRLTVVPHGALANVPFAALLDAGGAPLVRKYAISYLPSASLQRDLASQPLQRDPPRMLAIGNPEAPAPWPRLPSAEAEAAALSRVFPGSVLLAGAAATEERVRDLASGFNILHFATHGMLGGSIAGPASSLILTPTPRSDGYLTALEIAELDLSHDYLVVLSACETAVAAEGASTDLGAISGAFLSAGVPSVVGSLWKVSDASTARLMLRFYREFLEQGPGEALRLAQLELLEDPATEHPFHWAPFVLAGRDQ